MKRHKRRTFSGAVCEQIVYQVAERTELKNSRPRRPRFQNEEERKKHRDEISRRRLAQIVNANFSPLSMYVTLTMDADHEVHSADEIKKVRDNFLKRLAYKCPDVKYVVVYGKGKSTNRFHLHMIVEGATEQEIGRAWRQGNVADVRKLRAHNYYVHEDGTRVDHGRDYTALANYLHGHWQEEFGGHRYKASRNCQKPEAEGATIATREYDEKHPPIAPRGYVLIECRMTRYGYQYFKYVLDPKKQADREPFFKSLVNV